MNRWLSLCVAVAVLACVGSFGASVAFAQGGLNLGWGAFCPVAAGASDQTDPCDGTSLATYELVGTFKSGVALSQVNVEEVSLDLQEATALLSDYWHLEDENQPGQVNPAGCRGTNPATTNIGSLVVTAANLSVPTSSPCIKLWGSPSGGINYLPGFGSPDVARINMIWGKTTPSAITAAGQYYAFAAFIDTNHQIDDPANPPNYICSGCSNAVCIVYNQCVIRQPDQTPGGDITITAQDVRRTVTWQGGVGLDCSLVPVKRTSWGHLKSLYR